MAQIQAPYTFVTGDTVNAANLNAHTNGAVLLPGSITDQPDIVLPAVTGRTFTSIGGLVATVTSTAHGLSNGDQLDVTASVAAFSGRQTITVTSVDTFTFTLASTAPAVASGTLDYTKVNLVASNDSISIYDQSAAALKESTFGQILNSGLSLNSGTATINTTVTSAINGKSRSDINLTPNDGLIVTGKAFNSIDGITTTVTSTAHGLETGMLLDVTASNAIYSGQHYITVVSVDTFSFVINQTTPVAASGTLDYTKKGTVKSVGNQYVSGKLNVAGNLSVTGNATFNTTEAIKIPVGTTVQRPAIPVVGQFRYNSTFNEAEVYDGTLWKAVGGGPFDATGGGITTVDGYKIHTFIVSGTFTPDLTKEGKIEVLVVGGGGGGAYYNPHGGGGGGGAVVHDIINIPKGTTPITITVGSGGSVGASGTASTFALGPITANGGGAGSGYAGGTSGSSLAGTSGNFSSGGGGGGGARTASGYMFLGGGIGGQGFGSTIEGSLKVYGGGGGGAGSTYGSNSNYPGAGINGGASGAYSGAAAGLASINSGGGGGGGSGLHGRAASAGADGIVVIRYRVS